MRVHGDVTSLEVCHDGRTLVLGCADGSLQSYVVIDVDCDEDWLSLLSRLTTRDPNISASSSKRPSTSAAATTTRVWDKVVRKFLLQIALGRYENSRVDISFEIKTDFERLASLVIRTHTSPGVDWYFLVLFSTLVNNFFMFRSTNTGGIESPRADIQYSALLLKKIHDNILFPENRNDLANLPLLESS